MICEHGDRTRILKYVDSLTDPAKILNRVEGRWDEWGNTDDKKYLSTNVKVSERGGILIMKIQGNDWDISSANVIEGLNYIAHHRIILDFEFVTRIQEIYFTYPNGNPTVAKDEEWHPENPMIVNWSCELHH